MCRATSTCQASLNPPSQSTTRTRPTMTYRSSDRRLRDQFSPRLPHDQSVQTEPQTPLTLIVAPTEDEDSIVAKMEPITLIVVQIQTDVDVTVVTTDLTLPIAKLPTFLVLSQANPPTPHPQHSLQFVQHPHLKLSLSVLMSHSQAILSRRSPSKLTPPALFLPPVPLP